MADPDDPERVRVEALLERVVSGEATETEVTELRLYAEQDPSLETRLARGAADARLSEGWMARLEGDRQVELAERSVLTRLERGAGLAMILGGFGLTFIAPPWGAGLLTAGTVALLYSFIRVRIRTASTDPYRNVEK